MVQARTRITNQFQAVALIASSILSLIEQQAFVSRTIGSATSPWNL
jgi:hypothetical protein